MTGAGLLLAMPLLIALTAAGGAVWLFQALEREKSIAGKVLLWCGIFVCALVAFGIGTCYAMAFA